MATAAPKPQQPKPKDRIDLRLYNAIVIYDDYVVARSGEEARRCLLSSIKDGLIDPMEVVAKEVTMANSIRASKTDDSPLVAGDVSDAEFENLRGITTSNAFERFYLKR